MSGQPITLTLSRADFDWLRQVATLALAYGPGDPVGEDRVHRIRAAVEAALNAAPAEGSERAATGEMARCGRCGASFVPHPDPARFDHDFCEACLPDAVKHWGLMHTPPERRAAIVGGGED
jgi:hypothetical protein